MNLLKFGKKIDKIQKEVFKISNKEFNIASPKQLGEILYNDLKIADLKKTKNFYFNFKVTISKKKYLWMIKSRYISCLLDLKERDINNGLNEIALKYNNTIKFIIIN